MRTRWKILIGSGVFVLLLGGLSLVTMRVGPENRLEAYKKLLRDKGEKLELKEVIPPPAPPEQNCADAVQDAFKLFGSSGVEVPEAMNMIAPGKALVGWQQTKVLGFDYAKGGDVTNGWDEFALAVAAGKPARDLLAQVLEKPRLDFHLDYTKGIELLLPQLAPLKRSAQSLEAAAVNDLHQGNCASATTNILIVLALIRAHELNEQLLISHLVRIAIASIAVTPTWELLQATNVSDAQLASLQKSWEQLDFLQDAERTFNTERVWGINEIRKLRASHEQFQKLLGAYSAGGGFGGALGGSGSGASGWEAVTERARQAIGEAMWRSSWSYTDELRGLKTQQIILETLRAMQTNPAQFYKADYDVMTNQLNSIGVTHFGKSFFQALKIPDFSELDSMFSLGSVVNKDLRIETARRVVLTAIALKRFQLKHGSLPEKLVNLAPEFLASVPIDPMNGKPLSYRLNPDGTFTLYSVGPDGVDDGGDPSLPSTVSNPSYYWQNDKARDWVWPQPLTVEELQKYNEEQAAKAALDAAAKSGVADPATGLPALPGAMPGTTN